MGSLYLKDSHGLSDLNRAVLEDVAAQVRGLRIPWLIGGDWNLTPETLISSGFLGLVGGVVVTPSRPVTARCMIILWWIGGWLRRWWAAKGRKTEVFTHTGSA